MRLDLSGSIPISSGSFSKSSPRKMARHQAELDEIFETFRLFSQDSDRIDIDKLEVCMRSVGYTPSRDQLKQMITQLDKGGKGYVSFEEFSEILREKEQPKDIRDEATRAFRKINADNTGKISFTDLKKVLQDLGENMSDEQIRAMIAAADKDGDGQINFEEFMEMMHEAKEM